MQRMFVRFSVAALATLMIAIACPAQSAEDEPAEAPDKLREIQDQLDRARTRAESLEAEAKDLAAQTARLSKRLVAMAARIQGRESQIGATEKRLEGLARDDQQVRERLKKRRGVLAELLAALQRLEQNPPPALAVRPEDALEAVRSAMLLGVVVPELREEANALARDLASLRDLRQKIEREQHYLSQNLASLEIERGDLADILEAKRAASKLTAEEIRVERERMAELASKAKSFKELIARLEKEKTEEAKAPESVSPARAVVARATALARPSLTFSKAKGTLALPAHGVRIREFGAPDSFGSTAKGISIATRGGAQVTAPCDGAIVFAGPFRSYGELLIIDAGEGYHVLLAGLNRINVEVGQFVRAGEPMGTMGESAVSSAVIGGIEGDSRPILYVEFRNSGSSVDPSPWWAGSDEKVRG